MRIDLNDVVRVRPTANGLRQYADYYGGGLTLKPDADGWAEIQMHTLMMVFGPHIHLHLTADQQPFGMVIDVPEPASS